MSKKSVNQLATKILAFLTPIERRTSDEIAQAIEEDPQAVWLKLTNLAYRGKALSELVGSPMERKYRLDTRKFCPDKCRVCGGILVSGIEEFEPGLPSTFFALWTSNGAFCVRDDESGLKDVGYDCNYLYWKRRATNEIERSPFDES